MQVFVTGVSQGLGKALAEYFLGQGDYVVGIGRSHNIQHENFHFLKCNLQDIEAVEKLDLGAINENVLFINNAGIIGSIQRISEQTKSDIVSVLTVNTIATMLLCQKIMKGFPDDKELSIVNISSGAAQKAKPSWAAYCASKAAIDIFSETIYLEEKERARKTKVYAIAPGVIDTSMQEKIRASKEVDFSSVALFQDLKNQGILLSPAEVALKLAQLLKKEYTGQVIYRL